MKHFLAYGNSDQASFRDLEVRGAFDYMTVPGTIAAYYPDATAAFVLTSQLDYVIEPRTPLFQGHIESPRASHFALARWHGVAVENRIGDPEDPRPVDFSPDVYTAEAISEMVSRLAEEQSGYGRRASEIEEKLDRYRTLLAEALNEPLAEAAHQEARPPVFQLAPYFAVESDTDPWWDICTQIWDLCARPDLNLSPVVAVGSSGLLGPALAAAVTAASPDTMFYWVTGMDERRATESELTDVISAFQIPGISEVEVVNLYGSFFSIALGKAGLWGFNNGLGYSESRDWPDLPSTGAAPPRYYIRALHLFAAPTTAQLIVDADPRLQCDCEVCTPHSRNAIARLQFQYHEIKKHFALARKWEVDFANEHSSTEIAEHLREAADILEGPVTRTVPRRLVPDAAYLRRWANTIGSL